MALTTTTLAAACLASDTSIVVASATGFAARSFVRIDGETMQVAGSYSSGTTVAVRRGQDGGSSVAHASGANVTVGTGADFANPSPQTVDVYPIAGKAATTTSYSASGAITLPVPGSNALAILNGTSVLTMTVAGPTKDMDGCKLAISGNGDAAHTIQFGSSAGATGGLNAQGSGYDIVTVAARMLIEVTAVNGAWMVPCCPAMTGTVTNLVGGVA